MKKLMTVVILGFSFSLSACATRTEKVLDARWVSMKHANAPDVSTLKSVGSIEERYCMESWSGSYGLMDEAVKQAEQKHNIDYVRDASFTRDVGRSCVTMVGEGFRVLR